MYDVHAHFTGVDPCLEGNHICQQVCLNHKGNYSCTCEVGCALQADGFSCNGEHKVILLFVYVWFLFSDIDECLEHLSSCNQICTNKHCLEGQYNCSCEEGFYLSLFDNSTCLGNI